MKKVAEVRGMSTRTVERAIKGDLGYKSFRLRVRHSLTEAKMIQRVIRGNQLRCPLKSNGDRLRFFADKKLFIMDHTHNRHKNNWICQGPDDISIDFKSKNLVAVMVLGVVFSDAYVMPPHFLLMDLRINQEVY